MMDMDLQNRETQLSLIMVAFLLYLFSPVANWLWLLHELESGAYPVEADSIGIPLAGFILLWFVGLVMIPTSVVVVIIGKRILKRNSSETLC
jgi:hypothetical protein